jgi:hypothetical protein
MLPAPLPSSVVMAGLIRLDFVLLEINPMTLESFEEGER